LMKNQQTKKTGCRKISSQENGYLSFKETTKLLNYCLVFYF